MAGILSAFGRGKQKRDPMRESAALTTVYLLEQNQQFEQFMRQKVDELESRVAAQQARLSTREEAEEQELWAAMEAFEAPLEATSAVHDTNPIVETENELHQWESIEDIGSEAAYETESRGESEEIPDYLALMSGMASAPETNTDESSSELLVGEPEAALLEETSLFPSGKITDPEELSDEDEMIPPEQQGGQQAEPVEAFVPWSEAYFPESENDEEFDESWPEVETNDVEMLTIGVGRNQDEQLPADQVGSEVISFSQDAMLDRKENIGENLMDTIGIETETDPEAADALTDSKRQIAAQTQDQPANETETTVWKNPLPDGQKRDWT